MVLNFASQASNQYSITCSNQSSTSWYFFLYQRMSNQSDSQTYSLVWMLSPYKIGFQAFIQFVWSPDCSFVWLNTGPLTPGGIPLSGGQVSAALNTANSTTFDLVDNTPQFTKAAPGTPSNSYDLSIGATVPNAVFATGIGMSAHETFVAQSYANVLQTFSPTTTYWLAASTGPIALRTILSQDTIPNAISFAFPMNTYNLNASFGESNVWTLS